MRHRVVEDILAAACHVGKTIPFYKGNGTAFLMQILVTGKSLCDQLWEQEDQQRIRGLILLQAKCSEPRQMDTRIPEREDFFPAPHC